MMIKPGDKVICIKEIHYDNEFTTTYIKDNIYVVSKVNFEYGEKYIYIENVPIRTFFYIDNPIEEWKKFSDFFITLAEWRDKQIDLILNE